MHERALMDDVMRKIDAVARANGAVRVTRVTVRLGALSHFTPEMIQGFAAMGRWQDPARPKYLASVLEGRLKKILARYLTRLSPLATGVVLETVELET